MIGVFASFDPVHGETPGKTGDTAKDRFESFDEVMRDEILVHLDRSDPRLPLVRDPSFPADAHNHVIRMHAVDEMFQRVGVYLGVRVDLNFSAALGFLTHHEYDLKVIWGDTGQRMEFAKNVVVERTHPVVVCDAGEEMHEDELGITFPSVARFLVFRLAGHSAFDNDDRGCTMAIFRDCLLADQWYTRTHHNVPHTPSTDSPASRHYQRRCTP